MKNAFLISHSLDKQKILFFIKRITPKHQVNQLPENPTRFNWNILCHTIKFKSHLPRYRLKVFIIVLGLRYKTLLHNTGCQFLSNSKLHTGPINIFQINIIFQVNHHQVCYALKQTLLQPSARPPVLCQSFRFLIISTNFYSVQVKQNSKRLTKTI